MNNCCEKDILRFVDMQLPGKKICFVKDESAAKADNCLIHYKGFENADQIYNDTFFWDKYFDVVSFINEGIVVAK